MVVYHGRREWLFSTDINDLVDALENLIATYCLKPFTLINLNRIEDAVLKQKTWVGVTEMTNNMRFYEDPPKMFPSQI